ncbi:MAG: hypothetical protein GX639_03885 [Fibrobacter sp.]|nr:hypothetical protein [Fibrobacter sp.]
MRKAFDANVPKLKPRLRPAMVVVSGSKQEKKSEDTTTAFQKVISGTVADPQEKVLHPNTMTIAEPQVASESSIPDDSEDKILCESGTDVLGDEPVTNSEVADDVDRNSVSSSDAVLAECVVTEKSNEESHDRRELQVQINHIEQSVDSANAVAEQCTIASEPVRSVENLNGETAEMQSGIQPAVPNQTDALPVTTMFEIDDSEARRMRLENVKRKVSDAVRPEVRIEPVPEDPTLAVESVLGLVSDLEAQLSRSREVEKMLRNELAEAKAELTHTINDERTASGRLAQVEVQLDEKRNVLEEMLFEMGALEEERDQAVRMVQMLTIKEKERQQEVVKMQQQLTEMQRVVDESRLEEERLTGELDDYVKENTRLHMLLNEITKERDILVVNGELLTKERDDLKKAKMALEKVHNALSQARARLRE